MGKPVNKRTGPVSGAMSADAAKLRAAEYCLFRYPTLYTAGVPQREGSVWLVPIVLEDPELGILEQVGQLRIDAWTRQVFKSTSIDQVVAAGRRLYEGRVHAKPAAGASSRKK
jgi:hypothetical protein